MPRPLTLSLAGFLWLGCLFAGNAWLGGTITRAQTAAAKPEIKAYAAMNRNAVYYAGTGAAASYDLRGKYVTIGMMLPLTGPSADEGKSLLQAAEMAMDEEAKTPLADGQRLVLAVRDESGPWGQASDEIVHLILNDNAVAIITSPEGTIAHEAEQVANKIGVAVLTLSSDATTTQINMPWIFRLGPSDEDEALAFAQDIYVERRLRRVLLVAETDHDGRVGAHEFERAAERLGAAAPTRLNVPLASEAAESFRAEVKTVAPDAIVVWGDEEFAEHAIVGIGQTARQIPIYLCRKAAEFSPIVKGKKSGATSMQNASGIWVSGLNRAVTPARRRFESDFLARTATEPTQADAAVYDAIRLIAGALGSAGPNRVRVRDVLASGDAIDGPTESISFDSAGNERGTMTLTSKRR